MKTNYKVINDTAYNSETSLSVISVLERARIERIRICIHYGDSKTGEEWGDVETGYVGRSTGQYKIPLCVYNSRSMGGGAILDNCIVKITTSKGKITLWSKSI